MRCHQAKQLLIESARGVGILANHESLQAHLEDCADCRKEQRMLVLLEQLRTQASPGLSADSHRQMLQRLIRQAQTVSPNRTSLAQRSGWQWAVSVCAAAAVMALILWRLDRHDAVVSQQRQHALQTLQATVDGNIQMSGAQVSYLSGTALRIDDKRREVVLEKGEVDVDVTPVKQGAGSRFRVLTSRFVVEVLGTRFRVTEDSVYTLRGRVRVLSLDGLELATLGAGERWQLSTVPVASSLPAVDVPAPPTSPPVIPAAPAPSAETAPGLTAQPSRSVPSAVPSAVPSIVPSAVPSVVPSAEGSRPSPLTVRQKIALARSALADGNLVLTRQKLADAWKSAPSLAQRAALALLEADCLLSERRYPEAISAYRAVSDQYADDPSGETAAFALAQLLSERRSEEESRAAWESYLTRYPSGRFVREAQQRLRMRTETP